MSKARQIFSAWMVLALLSLSFGVQAQTTRRPVYRNNEVQTQRLLRRLEMNAERFRVSLGQALDQSRYDGTRREDNINTVLDDFNHVVDHVRERSAQQQLVASDVDALLARASRLDRFMTNQGNRLTARSQSDWTALKADLNQLAGIYNVAWRNNNDNTPYSPYPPTDNNSYNYDTGLTGTYRLNVAQSEDPRRQAQAATNNLPYRDRRRIYDAVVARLEPPAEIAIERRGDNVTIASTRAPQINFIADGNERTEQSASGNTIRARAAFYGDQLTVSSTGDRDSDYTVTFDPLSNGRRLQVTRRIAFTNGSAPIVVRSVYDRTADVARFDIYRGGQVSPSSTIGGRNDDYVLTNGTTLIATLNTDLNTRNAREGDRFTMTVREPSQFSGATIEGSISQVSRSGRVSGRSGLTFNFDRIRMRDGRTSNFSGFVESVRTVGGETVRVDNEGTVQESENRTNTTVQRTAIGTAVGAIIGAIAGGGKGAAIGAVLGAGGGAGSVYVQGSDDLDLRSGTEVTIRTSSPRQ
ncbi:MAG TPA: YMGG-like glycine zipper-containing protein [Pyrinomonadaceae bacterium]|nr:YMGG-like glycine zipper-containing protein [Pyrinomonadaceae bacterium]